MKLRLLLPLTLFAASTLHADNEIGFIERFALAPDREKVLAELIPGSEDYYIFHALHWQNTGQTAKLKAVLEQWTARFKNSERRKIIENRAALLGYDTDPQATLEFLRKRLALQFNHVQEARDQKPNLPTALEPAQVAREVFMNIALQADDLGALSETALEQLVRDKVALRPAQRRALLSKLSRPDLPGLVQIIAGELRTPESGGFGSFAIHRELLPEQLDELARLIPALGEQHAFVFTRLRKLAPGADADVEFDPVEREAWLERAWSYVETLSPSFNSLKAAVLYRRLQHDRARGVYDKARFLEYLKLPRPVGYMNPRYLAQPQISGQAVDLNADVSEALAGTRAIGDDETLVRDYLLHLLVDEPAWEPWAVWLRDTWLKPVFAEAKIVAGVGNPEQWASLLSPAAFQALKDRVDIDFAPDSAPFIPPAGDVNLTVFLKNTPKVIVKIYEINALNFFLTQKRELNTDLNLDGLVAHTERTHTFDDAAGTSPFLRARRVFSFPELKDRRGAWMIEFIGGGKSSRALIRKGQWHLIQHAGPAGDILTVLDENYAPVKDAVAWLDGRKFAPQSNGQLLIPFTAQPGSKQIVLADAAGGFATLSTFEHHAEEYQLDAQFHVEREELLARREATLAVRTALLIGGAQLPLDLLKDAKLAITSTTHDGVSTTKEIRAPALAVEKVFTHKFVVPDRLATLSVVLSGTIDLLSKGGEKQALSAGDSWQINGIDTTGATNDTHLSRFEKDGYVFELLGKNGEAIADQQVLFRVRHREIDHTLTIPLRTDERGRIALGALPGIAIVTAHAPNGRTGQWNLRTVQRVAASEIHALAGEVVRVPFTGGKQDASLLERRGATFTRDATAALSEAPGFLEIKGLAPGDYSLRLRGEDARDIDLRVTAGKPVQNWLLAPHRFLESRGAAPLQIASVTTTPDTITVKVANANAFTRVHVAATRFLPDVGLFGGLGDFTRFGPASAVPAKLPNLFAAGRQIGDEHRYILDRRYAKLFPGNMLTRPGLLLNPWEKRSTDLDATEMAAGQVPARTTGGRASLARKAAPESEDRPHPSSPALAKGTNLDFLANVAPVLYNLVPDKDGLVRIDRKALGDRQHVQLYVEDLASAVWQTLALPETGTKFADLRLVRNLDPEKAFSEKKEITVLKAGQSLTLADILTSEMETYDTLGGIFSLFTTLSGDVTLAKFAWVLEWPKMKGDEKRAKYSEFACHELSFFLSRKDPAFFAEVIQPYLGNKKDKTFMDEYLLGNDLRRYVEPWRFARLNVAERCLLAQRLPGESAATARHLRELWELLPPDPDRQDQLFETALRGRALQPGEGSFAGAKEKAESAVKEIEQFHLGKLLAPAAAPPPTNAAAAELSVKSRSMATRAESGLAAPDSPADPAAKGLPELKALEDLAERADVKFFHADEAQLQRATVRAYYRQLGPTKEWAENNYYRLPIVEQNAALIPINAFWRDYAAWDGKAPFLSTNVAEASRNFAEMMLALAVLDLPFEAAKHTTRSESGAYTLTAAGPIIVYHQEIKRTAAAPENAALLVSQNFYRHGDRYRMENNERFDKYVTEEFLAGTAYGANIVVTNPTSAPQKLELLLQIPQGALPVLGSKATASPRVRLEPYTTQTFEYFFYFPGATKPGAKFAHYPVHVSRAEETVGAAKPFAFNVVPRLTQFDTATWDYISQYGTDPEVFAFLEQNNIERLNLERVAWRARQSVDFFQKLIVLLEKRHTYSEPIYRYGIVHNDLPSLREWLRHRDDFLAQCGPWLDAKLVRIDPIERRAYEHLEYFPLVNQRAHRLGAEYQIANPVLRGQYQSLLTILAHKASMDAMDSMSVVYYLFLQDRVEEALDRFRAIQPEQLPTRLQHDYFRCYAAFYDAQLAEARGIATQYASHPVDRWRELFAEVTAQLDEIDGKAVTRPGDDQPNREKQQAELTATEPTFDFRVENRSIALTWKNLGEVAIHYYLMDPEFSFSSSPFVSQDASRFAVIKPNKSATQALPAGRDTLDIPLPADFARANVLVEIVAAGQRKAQAYHANTLKLTLAENYGRLDVRDSGTDKPVSRAYVKVYARLHGGTVRYFKDGYTDLRGRFDYASLNSSEARENSSVPGLAPLPAGGGLDYQMLRPNELTNVEKLAILILSESNGALVREVSPPSE